MCFLTLCCSNGFQGQMRDGFLLNCWHEAFYSQAAICLEYGLLLLGSLVSWAHRDLGLCWMSVSGPFWFTPPTLWWGRDLPLMHPETVKQSWAKYYLFFLLEWNNAICGNMDGPRNDHSKSSKSDKDKYHMTPLICGILNMTWVNLSTQQKRAHRHRTQTCSCQGVGS